MKKPVNNEKVSIESLQTLFATYNALGRVSTLLPHQFTKKGEVKKNLSTTLLTPDGRGISMYAQRHTRTNFGKERKGRNARQIILVFAYDQVTVRDHFPNEYYAKTDIRSLPRGHWDPGPCTSPDTHPVAIREIYSRLTHNSNQQKVKYFSRAEIAHKTDLKTLQAIAQAIHLARQTLDYKDYSLRYSEVLIGNRPDRKPQLAGVFVQSGNPQDRVIAYLSTQKMNKEQPSRPIPMAIPHPEKQGIAEYRLQDFIQDILHMKFSYSDGRHWGQDLRLLGPIDSQLDAIFTELSKPCAGPDWVEDSHHGGEKRAQAETEGDCLSASKQQYSGAHPPLKRPSLHYLMMLIYCKLGRFNPQQHTNCLSQLTTAEKETLLLTATEFKRSTLAITLIKNLNIDRSLIPALLNPNNPTMTSLSIASEHSFSTIGLHVLAKLIATHDHSSRSIPQIVKASQADPNRPRRNSCLAQLSALNCCRSCCWEQFLMMLQSHCDKSDHGQYRHALCEKLVSLSKKGSRSTFIAHALGLKLVIARSVSLTLSIGYRSQQTIKGNNGLTLVSHGQRVTDEIVKKLKEQHIQTITVECPIPFNTLKGAAQVYLEEYHNKLPSPETTASSVNCT